MQVLWNIDYGDILPFGIINRIFRPALLTVEDGDHTASVVDHPFIAALEAATIILRRNETDDIGTGQSRSIQQPLSIQRDARMRHLRIQATQAGTNNGQWKADGIMGLLQ